MTDDACTTRLVEPDARGLLVADSQAQSHPDLFADASSTARAPDASDDASYRPEPRHALLRQLASAPYRASTAARIPGASDDASSPAGPCHALLHQLAATPHRFDFFEAVRLLESVHPGLPRLGTSLRLRDDGIRFGQAPSLAFAPATLGRFAPGAAGRPPTLSQRFFGLFGANGPLPLHLTEFARERSRRTPSDTALVRFLDMFHHRLLSLFYRAWAEARPTVCGDRPDDDPFARRVAAIAGYGQATLRDRDAVPDGARLAAAGILARPARGAEGLERILADFFRVPVRVHPWQPHWMRLPPQERLRIGSTPARLGLDTVLGARIPDCQTRFRLELGPLTLARYERFLPGGEGLRRLHDWVLSYVGHELSCEARLVLRGDEVPALALGRAGRLGWTSWLSGRPEATDAGDLVLEVT